MNREHLKKLVLEELEKTQDEEEGCLEEMGCPDSQDTIDHSHEQEGKMHRSSLFKMAKYSVDLLDIIQDEDDLPEWVESKITKAADYLGIVKHYLEADDAREMGALEEAGYYKNPDRDEIDSGIGKKAMGITPEFEKMRKDAKREKQLQGALVGDISLLKYREGGATPRRIKALIRKYKKKAEKEGIQFEVPPFSDVLEEDQLKEISSYDMRTEEIASNIARIATSAMLRAKDPDAVHPTLLKYFFDDEDDKIAFLDVIREEIMKELRESERTYNEGIEEYLHIEDATYDDGTPVEEDVDFWDDVVMEAEYQGRKVTLNKPMKGDVKKSKVYVKNEKGNVIKVNFGDPNMKIKKSNPKRRKSFRARHNCKNPGPKTKARYWSCRAW
jgi:hypothetical protein